jgi:hypothetical protein
MRLGGEIVAPKKSAYYSANTGRTMVNLLFSTSGRIPRWKFWLAYLPVLFGAAPLIIFIETYAGNNPILGLLVIGLYVWIAVCLAAKSKLQEWLRPNSSLSPEIGVAS